MKRNGTIILAVLLFGFALLGCESAKNPMEIYDNALTSMNEEIYYYKMTTTTNLQGNVSTISESENLIKEDMFQGIMHSAIDTKYASVMVVDGNSIYSLYPSADGKMIYNKEESNTESSHEHFTSFTKRSNVSSLQLLSSDSEKINDGYILSFAYGNEEAEEYNGKVEIEITVENNRITKTVSKSYALEEDVLSQEITKVYSDFNAKDTIPVKETIAELEKQASE